MPKDIIATDRAPAAIGPYSQAVRIGPLVFVSGQLPLDPATGMKISGGTTQQTERCLENLKAVLEASGCGLQNVVKVGVYLKSLDDFKFMNEVYQRYFGENPPARTTVQAVLPRDAALEIDAIAVIG